MSGPFGQALKLGGHDGNHFTHLLGEPSGEDGLAYALITFWLDYLQEEFPGLTKAQFSRCYVRAAYETDAWRKGSGGTP